MLYYKPVVGALTEHIREIDYLRGFAILAVVIIHTSASFTSVPYIDGVVVTNVILDIFTHFAVPLFICISGFVLYLKYKDRYNYQEYYKKRFLRIIPPYLIFTTVYLAYTAFGKAYLSGEFVFPSALQILYAYLGAGGYYHLWFFLIIIELYLIYPILEKIFSAAAKKSREWIILLVALLLQFGWQIFGTYWQLEMFGYELNITNKLFLCRIFYFVLGMWICHHFKEIKSFLTSEEKSKTVLYAFLVGGILLLTAINSYGWLSGMAAFGDYYAIPGSYFIPYDLTLPLYYLLTFAGLYILSVRLSRKNLWKSIVVAGGYSYGIYLIHPLIMGFLGKLFFPIIGIDATNAVFYILMFAITFAGSMIAVWIIQKLPGHKYIIG